MTLIDYVEWRGDLSFKQSPFCPVDALILCQLSYLNFDGLLAAGVKPSVSLSALWGLFRNSDDFESRCNLGALISKNTLILFEKCAGSPRYKNIPVGGYVSKIDLENEEQFSAMTFFCGPLHSLPFVAFRGTDDTIVGWKEDFNLALEEVVPAQRDALDYLTELASKTRGKISVGGHSKGGNLAVYSSAFAERKYGRRIKNVYNFDGPGFRKEIIESYSVKRILPALHSFYPKLSVVGMLFRHAGAHTVVESDAFGIMQHDPFSWHIKPLGFETLENFDRSTEVIYKTFNEWIEGISAEKRTLFVETLFKILTAGGAKTNSELEKNWFKSAVSIIKAAGELDKETRDEVMLLVQHLVELGARNLK